MLHAGLQKTGIFSPEERKELLAGAGLPTALQAFPAQKFPEAPQVG
jgi:hypothetical protein